MYHRYCKTKEGEPLAVGSTIGPEFSGRLSFPVIWIYRKPAKFLIKNRINKEGPLKSFRGGLMFRLATRYSSGASKLENNLLAALCQKLPGTGHFSHFAVNPI